VENTLIVQADHLIYLWVPWIRDNKSKNDEFGWHYALLPVRKEVWNWL